MKFSLKYGEWSRKTRNNEKRAWRREQRAWRMVHKEKVHRAESMEQSAEGKTGK